MVEVLDLQPRNPNFKRDLNTEICGDIEYFVCTQLSYNKFYWEYMDANWPVVLTAVSNEWICRHDWIHEGEDIGHYNGAYDNPANSAINFDYLNLMFEKCDRVPVADCSTRYFNSHIKNEMSFCDFLSHWRDKAMKNVLLASKNASITCNVSNLYLKDWHLQAQMPNYKFYKVPKHFASDWLNEYLINTGRDDYRFVYMGPKDSWTPFHTDVFGSFSWSTNVVGRKKWILLPPGEELKLADRLGNLPFCIDEDQLSEKRVRFFVLLQKENEAVFVPSGWFHQVWNLTDTISVNHNWFNACNVKQIWYNLSTNMEKVVAEIDDCRQMDNFDEHCQTMLRANFGINYIDFLDMLEFIARHRLKCFEDGNDPAKVSSNLLLFDTFTLNDFHVRNDLEQIRAVVETMLNNVTVCNSRNVLYRRCVELLQSIEKY